MKRCVAVRFELKMMRQLESTMQLQKMIQEIFVGSAEGYRGTEQRSGSNRLKDLRFFLLFVYVVVHDFALGGYPFMLNEF